MQPSFQLLPTEVLEKIFVYLGFSDFNSVALVCRGWSTVAQTPRLWKDIKLEVKAQNFKEVTRIPRLALVNNLVLGTNDVVKTSKLLTLIQLLNCMCIDSFVFFNS